MFDKIILFKKAEVCTDYRSCRPHWGDTCRRSRPSSPCSVRCPDTGWARSRPSPSGSGRRRFLKQREREMFHLTTHSTHFIYGYMASDIWLRTILIVREREMFYLTTHSTHFIYGYMASDIWLRTILIVRRERNVSFNDTLNTFLSTVIWRQTYG